MTKGERLIVGLAVLCALLTLALLTREFIDAVRSGTSSAP